MREIEFRSYGETLVDPLALVLTIAMGIVLISSSRSRAVLPIVVVACLLPVAQRIVIAGLDFNFIRIMIVFGWARVLARGEARHFRLNRIDKAFLLWVLASTAVQVLRDQTSAAFIYRMGVNLDAGGAYFLVRLLLRSPQDIERLIVSLAPLAAVIAGFMLLESLTGRNVFHVFGGAPEFTQARYGRIRCQAAFSHAIMAGSFGAMLAPLFVGVGLGQAKARVWAALGFVGATVITATSASSGPAMSYAFGMIAWTMWGLRGRMREFRWLLVAVLTIVHFIRSKPVWHLIHRLGTIIGGSGYHRYRLIDAFINRFSDWFLLGTRRVGSWGWGLQDVTNQFVLEGVNGGLAALASFILVLTRLYSAVGSIVKRVESAPTRTRKRVGYLAWGLGAGLTAHVASFISVSYFGQLQVLLFLHFAMISSAFSAVCQRSRHERALEKRLPPLTREAPGTA
jgi:hypothetical protein